MMATCLLLWNEGAEPKAELWYELVLWFWHFKEVVGRGGAVEPEASLWKNIIMGEPICS